jgi:hypothetical protein
MIFPVSLNDSPEQCRDNKEHDQGNGKILKFTRAEDLNLPGVGVDLFQSLE